MTPDKRRFRKRSASFHGFDDRIALFSTIEPKATRPQSRPFVQVNRFSRSLTSLLRGRPAGSPIVPASTRSDPLTPSTWKQDDVCHAPFGCRSSSYALSLFFSSWADG